MSPYSATASALSSAPTACFSVIADAEPGLMLRVLEAFAKRGLLPTHCYSRVSGGELSLDLQVAGLDRATAAHLASCFRQIPSVRTVLTSERAASLGPAARRPAESRARR